MWARILCTAAMVVLPVATWAQEGLRSASLPERPLTSTLSPARGDLFLAEPDTYAPGNDRYDTPGPFLGHIPVYWYMTDVFMEAGRKGPPYGNEGHRRAKTRPRYWESDPPTRPDSWGQIRSPAEPPPAERPPAAAPGIPKTFYVIAGCYAGDTPPRPDRLPADCDPSKVRVISP